MKGKKLFVRVLSAILLTGGVYGAIALAADAPKGTADGPSAGQPASAPAPGKVVGIVIEKGAKDITVKPEGVKMPVLFHLPEQDAAITATLKTIFPDNLVAIDGKMGKGQPVVTGIKLIMPKGQSGTIAGTVMDKGSGQKLYIDVKPADGYTQRYVPNWDPAAKGWLKDMVAAIAAANVGDKVEVQWTYPWAERIRIVGLKVTAKAGAPKGATSKPAGT